MRGTYGRKALQESRQSDGLTDRSESREVQNEKILSIL